MIPVEIPVGTEKVSTEGVNNIMMNVRYKSSTKLKLILFCHV